MKKENVNLLNEKICIGRGCGRTRWLLRSLSDAYKENFDNNTKVATTSDDKDN